MQMSQKPSGWQIIKYADYELMFKIRDDSDLSVVAEVFEWEEYGAVAETIKNLSLPVVDVGAHSGAFSLWTRCLNSAVPIFALEPSAANFALLKENLEANDADDVMTYRLALASQTGTGKLALTADSINYHLLKPGATTAFPVESVPTETLPDFLRRAGVQEVGLLKLDIEGGEYETLFQLPSSVWPKIHNVVLEFHPHPLYEQQTLEELLHTHFAGVERVSSRFDKKFGFLIATQ